MLGTQRLCSMFLNASSNSESSHYMRIRNSYYHLSLAIPMSRVKQHGSVILAGASQISTSQGFACVSVGHWQKTSVSPLLHFVNVELL